MYTPTAIQPVHIGRIRVNERGVWQIAFTVLDETGAPVPLAAVTAFTIEIVNDDDTPQTVLRAAASVLNVNGGTFHDTNGAVTFASTSADNRIISTTIARDQIERHTALLTLTWGSSKRWDGEVQLEVVNLNRVP